MITITVCNNTLDFSKLQAYNEQGGGGGGGVKGFSHGLTGEVVKSFACAFGGQKCFMCYSSKSTPAPLHPKLMKYPNRTGLNCLFF